jgi:hypothetical protein
MGEERLTEVKKLGQDLTLVRTGEHDLDRAARIEAERAEGEHRRLMERIVLYAFAGSVATAFLCAFALFVIYSDPRDKEWARTVLMAILTGGISYMAGKQSQK